MFFGGLFSISSYSIWALCYVNTAKIRKPSNQTILKTFPKNCFKRTKFVTVLNHAMDINEYSHDSMYCMWMHCVLVSSSASDQGVEMEIPCSDRRSPALHWLCNPPQVWIALYRFCCNVGEWRTRCIAVFERSCTHRWLRYFALIFGSYLYICLSVYLSICLSVYLSICLSVYLSICLSVYLSICLSICLSVYLSVCLSVCLSACLSVCLSVCLSIYTPGSKPIWGPYGHDPGHMGQPTCDSPYHAHMGHIWVEAGRTHRGMVWAVPCGWHMGNQWASPCGHGSGYPMWETWEKTGQAHMGMEWAVPCGLHMGKQWACPCGHGMGCPMWFTYGEAMGKPMWACYAYPMWETYVKRLGKPIWALNGLSHVGYTWGNNVQAHVGMLWAEQYIYISGCSIYTHCTQGGGGAPLLRLKKTICKQNVNKRGEIDWKELLLTIFMKGCPFLHLTTVLSRIQEYQ